MTTSGVVQQRTGFVMAVGNGAVGKTSVARVLDLVSRGKFGEMVSLSCNRIISVKIEDAIERKKRIDPNGEYVNIARSLGVSMGD